MKKVLLVLILFLFYIDSKAGGVKIEIKSDSIEWARRSIARNLLDFDFKIDDSKKKYAIFKSDNNQGGYFFQILLTHTKKKIIMDGYIFMKEGYKWAYRISDEEAMKYLKKIMVYCEDDIKGIPHLDKNSYYYRYHQ